MPAESDVRDAHVLSDALDFVSREARTWVLDAVYCSFSNIAGDLEGNTAEHDVEWFARNLWERFGERRNWPVGPAVEEHLLGRRAVCPRWDVAGEPEKELWRAIAKTSLDTLPGLMSRVAHRCRAVAAAVNAVLKAERAAAKVAR
jgi:hypothetical protein